MTIGDAVTRPGVVGADASASGDTLVAGGRFGCGIDRWAYVPFDVPPGVGRISVSTSHDRFSLFGVVRNVLDLGIFGPTSRDVGSSIEGFRGWSGGARDAFTLSVTDATPGYLPGPIDPGRWALALGPVVLNPVGMRWQACIQLEHGAGPPRPSSSAVTSTAPVSAAGRDGNAGWFRGDLHLHTVHSDGRHHPRDLVIAARAAGLDFIASTEHNTSSAHQIWGAWSSDGPVVIPGEEVTTRHGHWLAVGLPPGQVIDWRYAPRDGLFAGHAAHVRATGAVVVAAHPAVPMPGSAWEFGYRDVDALEVWNGRWNLDDEASLRMWHRLLRHGRRLAAVGGSDSHAAHQPVGHPQTVVHASQLSTPALLEGLRRARCYIAESSAVTLQVIASCSAGEQTWTAGLGDTLPTPPHTEVIVTAAVSGAPNTRLALITDGGCVARLRIGDSGEGRLRWTAPAGRTPFVRVEVRRPTRGRLPAMVAMSNPVWLTPSRGPCPTGGS